LLPANEITQELTLKNREVVDALLQVGHQPACLSVHLGQFIGYNFGVLTFNIPPILIVREAIFYAGEAHIGDFKGIFEGAQTFLNPKLSRA